MVETIDMTDDQLDAMIANNPSEHDVVEEVDSSGSEDVSPLDDIEEGQTNEDESVADVGQSDESEEDSEDNLSLDDDESEEYEDEPETDNESEDGNSDEDLEDTDEASNESMAFQPLRANGQEYPIENLQELYTLASKGINADKKWDESAEGRRMISTMQKTGISMDDFNLLVEASKGNQNALLSILKKNNIDPIDLDADAFNDNYKPEDHSTGQFEVDLDNIVSKIKTQPRYQESVNVIMENWDETSKQEFYNNPKILELLNVDMQVDNNGFSMYDRVAPIAEKMKALESGVRKSDLEYYMMAGRNVLDSISKSEQSKIEADKKRVEKVNDKKNINKRKKKAAGSSGGRSPGKTAKDVTDLTDEELDALLDRTS